MKSANTQCLGPPEALNFPDFDPRISALLSGQFIYYPTSRMFDFNNQHPFWSST